MRDDIYPKYVIYVFAISYQQCFDLFVFLSYIYSESVVGGFKESMFNVCVDFSAFEGFVTEVSYFGSTKSFSLSISQPLSVFFFDLSLIPNPKLI